MKIIPVVGAILLALALAFGSTGCTLGESGTADAVEVCVCPDCAVLTCEECEKCSSCECAECDEMGPGCNPKCEKCAAEAACACAECANGEINCADCATCSTCACEECKGPGCDPKCEKCADRHVSGDDGN